MIRYSDKTVLHNGRPTDLTDAFSDRPAEDLPDSPVSFRAGSMCSPAGVPVNLVDKNWLRLRSKVIACVCGGTVQHLITWLR